MTIDPWAERRSGKSQQRENDYRSPWARDRARMIHSSSFRRLQAKTQVLGVGESDFYRTRLTHSLEVAQIGAGIVQNLPHVYPDSPWKAYLPPVDLILTICLAHDLGHPPFGHGGEVALNHMMKNHGGFEGNGQTLRILAHLDKYTDSFGMDLTRRAMLGILKYPVRYSDVLSKRHRDPEFRDKPYASHREVVASDWKPPKCYFDEDAEIVDWILDPLSREDRDNFTAYKEADTEQKHAKAHHKSFDTTIMDLADDIAYGIHDLEDAISLKLVTKEMWFEEVLGNLKKSGCKFNGIDIADASKNLFDSEYCKRKEAIGGFVNWLITAANVQERAAFDSPLLRYRLTLPPQDESALKIIKDFVVDTVIKSPPVQLLEFKGQQMIMAIFEALNADPERLLPKSTVAKWRAYKGKHCANSAERVICDYVSGMTDDYAARIYKMLFVAGDGSIFHKL